MGSLEEKNLQKVTIQTNERFIVNVVIEDVTIGQFIFNIDEVEISAGKKPKVKFNAELTSVDLTLL